MMPAVAIQQNLVENVSTNDSSCVMPAREKATQVRLLVRNVRDPGKVRVFYAQLVAAKRQVNEIVITGGGIR